MAVIIGMRKAPTPDRRPGLVRIDSFHQGDQDGTKGLNHINAVDRVIQWQVVVTVQTISEAHLLPVIEQMLAQFPFELLGFHADNGNEYVNRQVARMLDKLPIGFSRSGARAQRRQRRGPDRERCGRARTVRLVKSATAPSTAIFSSTSKPKAAFHHRYQS